MKIHNKLIKSTKVAAKTDSWGDFIITILTRRVYNAGHGSRVTGHGSRVMGHRSQVTGHGSQATDKYFFTLMK